MKKKTYSLLTALVLTAMCCWVMFSLKPLRLRENPPLSEFGTRRAMDHVRSIGARPHYVGTAAHDAVADYLTRELRNLGLQPQIQQGFAITEANKLVYVCNLMARIPGKGGGKALVLLSHYDSAPHSKSPGASDNAAGVATILEGVRAFLHAKTAHRNDIILLFTDAEELGLNGAALFVREHVWAKDVGLVLNFEARGSGGPSCMLMEVNDGNAAMVEGFAEAGTKFPVTNSLMYSVYKMLPNDTDLTIFREDGRIQGFNFAFIDDHFDYHTIQDDPAHLDPTTLAHQGRYLMPLLAHFGNADLGRLTSDKDRNYFNTPLGLVHYPFGWNVALLAIAFVLFAAIVFLGLGKRVLVPHEMAKGFFPLLATLLIAILVSWGGWQMLQLLYPDYAEIQQGFTYNGYWYLAAFSALTLAVCFYTYKKASARHRTMSHFVASLLLWMLINTAICFFLPGAGFFIIPAFSGLLMLGAFVLTQRVNRILNWVLAFPTVVILLPFIKLFPVGLGLKMLPGAAVLIVFAFALLLPVFGQFPRKNLWGSAFAAIAAVCFLKAHLDSGYEKGKAFPDSLVYYLNADTGNAYWASYDSQADEWTQPHLGDKPQAATVPNQLPLSSKYGRRFRLMSAAPLHTFEGPSVVFLRDSVANGKRHLHLRITPRRKVNRYDVFTTKKTAIGDLKANGLSVPRGGTSKMGGTGEEGLLISYYVVGQRPLDLEFNVPASAKPQLELLESSFDLLEHPELNVAPRPGHLMPKPFLVNDAIIIRKKIMRTAPVSVPSHQTNEPVGDTIQAENRNG